MNVPGFPGPFRRNYVTMLIIHLTSVSIGVGGGDGDDEP